MRQHPPNHAFSQLPRDTQVAHKLSQAHLARRPQEQELSAHPSYIAKIERYQVAIPSTAFIAGVATALEVDVDQLLTVAGKFDARELHRVVAEMPKLSRVLRRLSDQPIALHQVHHLLEVLDHPDTRRNHDDHTQHNVLTFDNDSSFHPVQ